MENITNKFNLSINNEYLSSLNNIINIWINPDYKCQKCHKSSLKCKYNNKFINNPVKLQCS